MLIFYVYIAENKLDKLPPVQPSTWSTNGLFRSRCSGETNFQSQPYLQNNNNSNNNTNINNNTNSNNNSNGRLKKFNVSNGVNGIKMENVHTIEQNGYQYNNTNTTKKNHLYKEETNDNKQMSDNDLASTQTNITNELNINESSMSCSTTENESSSGNNSKEREMISSQ